MIHIEQRDREAAAEAYNSPAHRAAILTGKRDDWPFVQAAAAYRQRLTTNTIATDALRKIAALRPAGDVETCTAPRKLVEQMERIALDALTQGQPA